MRYETMRPEAIRGAIRGGWPLVLPVGVLEYHAEHLPVGVDGLVVEGCLERLGLEMNLVVMPTFWWGAASHAVAAPEGTGTVHVDAEALVPVARAILAGLLRVGFRDIHLVIHHQTEGFAQGMPTDLAFRLAARQAVMAHLERERGEGWWGRSEAQDFYAEQACGRDPFSWIKAHPLLTAEGIAGFPFDHAGQGETSLMQALFPATVEMAALGEEAPWYARSATDASAGLGEAGVAIILDHLRQALGANAKEAPSLVSPKGVTAPLEPPTNC